LNWQSPRTLQHLSFAFFWLGIGTLYVIEYDLVTDLLVQLGVVLMGLVLIMTAATLSSWGHYKYGRYWRLRDVPVDDPSHDDKS